jgi:hypothetical protein
MTAARGWAARASVVTAVYFAARELAELRALCSLTREMRTDHHPPDALARVLAERIRWFESDRRLRRPPLRAPASTTLRTGRGFCGENARVAVLCLMLLGYRANRIYIWGERWGHVAVEYLDAGTWWLFDAHNDPGTILSPERTGTVRADELGSYPNGYRDENPWVSVTRWHRRFKLPMHRPPTQASFLLESPLAMKAAAAAAAGALALRQSASETS